MTEAAVLVARTLDVEYSEVLELLPDRDVFLLRAGSGWQEERVGTATVGAGPKSQPGYTILLDEPVIVDDSRMETRFGTPLLWLEHGAVSSITVVIQGRERPFGVLGAHATREKAFNQADVYFLQSVANVLGLSVERARTESVGRAEDVTERNQVEKELSESRLRLQALFDNALDAIFITDDEGRFVDANPAACALLGYSRHELMQMSTRDVIRPASRRLRDALLGAFRKEGKLGGEYAVIRQDGTIREIEFRAVANILPGLHMSVNRDITDRKRAREERARDAAQLQALARASLAINSARSVEETVQVIADQAREIVGALQAVISLTGDESDGPDIVRISLSEKCSGSPAHVATPGSDVYSLVCRENRVVHMNQVVAAPLVRHDGRNLGLIQLSGRYAGDLKASDEAILMQLARSGAVAIENVRLLEEVQETREQLKSLSRRLVEAHEIESRRIARELHDEIGQLLTGLHLTLEIAIRDSGASREIRLKEGLALVGELLAQVRQLSLNLRPPMLDDLGLLRALQSQLEHHTAQTDVKVAFRHSGLDRRFQPEIEMAAYRIVQEALTNVVRHSGLKEATVSLSADERVLQIRIEDRGRGFDVKAAFGGSTSSGLSGMRERALLLGGELTVESVSGAGCCVSAALPLKRSF